MSDGIQSPQHHSPLAAEDLVKLGVESRLIPFVVSTTLRAEQSLDGVPSLSPAEARDLVEILDKVVSSTTVNPSLKNRCFKVLRRASPSHAVLPKSHYLDGVTLSDTIPYASGGFADIWKGQHNGNQMCVKAFRTQTAENLARIKRQFYREIVAWKYVSHANVLPFLGVSETLFAFCIISPWLSNGNIIEYTKRKQGVNRLQLLAQAASGLEYLHSLSIVHSDINPGNILITEDGTACLGDYGITSVITDPTAVEQGNTTTSKPGVVRYMAPELLNPSQFSLPNSNPTKESDIYSLAMTAYETLTEILPYGSARDGIIIFHVVTGDRPPRPPNNPWLRGQIWNMIETCWSKERELRWDIHAVYNQLSMSSIQEVVDAFLERRSSVTLSVQAEVPSLPIKQSSTTEPPESKERPRSQTASTPKRTIQRKNLRFPTLPRTANDAGEPRSGLRVREERTQNTLLSRGQNHLQTVVETLRAFLRFERFPGTNARPSE